MLLRYRGATIGLAIAASVLTALPSGADPREHERREHGDRRDHDEARFAVEHGEIKPLAELLAIVRDKLPGEITGVELERKHEQWLYEFRVIDKAGRLFEVYVDAQSGDIKRTKEK
jgi:uncharacterized membrane protein YkoI